MRVEHEYTLGGALAYLDAWDVHRTKVFGRCEQTTGTQPFDRLVGQVMTCQHYADAERAAAGAPNCSSQRPLAEPSIRLKTKCWPSRYSLLQSSAGERAGIGGLPLGQQGIYTIEWRKLRDGYKRASSSTYRKSHRPRPLLAVCAQDEHDSAIGKP